MKYHSIAVIMAITFAASVHASDSMSTVWTKKFSDKPPYQRQKEILNSADLTQFEVATEVVKTTILVADHPSTVL